MKKRTRTSELARIGSFGDAGDIQSRIVSVRGVQVMLDRDLAAAYQVSTSVFNQAVKRNLNRFP